jgi:hypothetical protein
MLGQYITHIANHSNSKGALMEKYHIWGEDGSYLTPNTGRHCALEKNLLFPGDGLSSYQILELITGKLHERGENQATSALYLKFLPQKYLAVKSSWERVSPNHLKVLAGGYVSNTVYNKFGFQSCEAKLTLDIVGVWLLKVNFHEYEN